MKRKWLLIVLCVLFNFAFAQNIEMQKIMKYVVAKSKTTYLYQEADYKSPVLVISILPEPEDDVVGDYMGTEFKWESNYKSVNDTLIVRSRILPVVSEMRDWYQVFFTSQNEELIEGSVTAFVPKSEYVETQVETIKSQTLPSISEMKFTIRTAGKYKDYCMMWGDSEYLSGSIFYLGKIIDDIAYFSNYRYFTIDSENHTITLHYDYEVGGKSLNLGKKYYKDGNYGCEADFIQLTDEDLDLIVRWYDSNYKTAYIKVVGVKEPYCVDIEALAEAKILEVITEPEFEGGQDALFKWWNSHFKIPKETIENGVNGRTIVTFVIKEDGTVDNVKLSRPIDFAFDRAVINTVKAMPKWKPGKKNGKHVSVTYSMPINIKTP